MSEIAPSPQIPAHDPTVVRVADIGAFLATRHSARRLIAGHLEAVPRDVPLVLDWSGVYAITGAFADELVAWMFAEDRPIANRGMSEALLEVYDVVLARRREARAGRS